MEEALGAGGAAESFRGGGPSCAQGGLADSDVVAALTWPRTRKEWVFADPAAAVGARAAVLGFGSALLF